jgi:hypothetical protein
MPLVAGARVARIWGVFKPLQSVAASGDDGRAQWTNYLAVFAHWIIAPLGVAGLVLLHRRRVPVFPLTAQFVLVTVAAVLVWGAVRFRVPADVVLIIGAGIAIDRMYASVRTRELTS